MNRFVRYLMLALAVSWAVPSDAAPLRRRFNRGTTRRPVQEKKHVTPEMQKSLDAGDPMAQPLGWGGGGSGGGSGLTVTGTPAAGDTVVYRSDVATPGYYLQKAGTPVLNVKAMGASGSNLQGTGTVSSSSTSLAMTDNATLGSDASDWVDTAAKGQGIVVFGAGATHAIGAPASAPLVGNLGTAGATTYTYGAYSITGDGGWSAVGTTAATTTGNATLSSTNANYVCVPIVANADGYGFTGRGSSNRLTLTVVNGSPTCYLLTFQAGGYDAFEQADIGTTITQASTSSTGIIMAYDNTARTCWVLPTEFSDDTYSSGASTVTGGSDGGTTTGAATTGVYFKDTGDATAETVAPNRSFCRRASDEFRTTDIIIHPFTNAGMQYRVCRTRLQADENDPKTSSTANGSVSYTNTMGAETRDGDIYVVRENAMFPVAEPSAAVPNALVTTIASISGTTITMADAAGNSVTNGIVAHDDYPAINSALTAWQAATEATGTLYFPPGHYNIWSDTAGSRWSTSGGGIRYLLQPQRNSGHGGTILLHDDAWIDWCSMYNDADQTTASITSQCLFYANGDNDITFDGGHWSYKWQNEPNHESADANASNGCRWLNDSLTGTDQYSRNRTIRNCEFYGWPSWMREENDRGRGQGTVIENVYVEYGSADDFCWFGLFGPTVRNLHVHGVQFSRSTGLYSAANSAVVPDTLLDGCTFYRTKRDGVRLRCDNTTVVNCKFLYAGGSNALLLEGFTGATVNGNQFINGGSVNISTNNITFNGNSLRNAQLAIAGGSKFNSAGTTIHWDSNASTYFTVADTYAINITGGAGITFTGLILDNDQADGGNNPDRGITITGGSNIHFGSPDIEVAGERPLGISGGVTGPLSITGGRIYGGISTGINFGPDSDTCQLTMSGVTIDSASSDDTMLGSNGILYCKSCTFNSPVNFTTLDSLTLDGCEMAPTGSGTCTIATAGGRLIENNWGEAPTLTGTLLYTKGNLIAGSGVSSPAALSIGANALTLPVTDYVRLDPNASNSSLSGMTARANGVEVITVNVDGGAATLTYTNNSNVTEADEFLTSTGSNIGADSVNKSRQWWYDGTTGKWRDK